MKTFCVSLSSNLCQSLSSGLLKFSALPFPIFLTYTHTRAAKCTHSHTRALAHTHKHTLALFPPPFPSFLRKLIYFLTLSKHLHPKDDPHKIRIEKKNRKS